MNITFWGAAGEVTGSCHLLQIGEHRILLDCGLVQGGPKDEARNREAFPFDPRRIDAVVLSHAHIDHSGRIPSLVKAGFEGPVYTQRASRDLCGIMLKDAAFLNERDVAWDNRKRERKGLPLIEPLYTMEDARHALRQFKALDYDEPREILPGVTLRLLDAGHILGSAIVELSLREGSMRRRLVFSGDLGKDQTPILRDCALLEEADLVVMESTYGDRLHRPWEQTLEEMEGIIRSARHEKGNILIPAFAVGRTQTLLYLFAKYYREWGLDRWRIVLDSPLAIEATEIYARHAELYDEEAAALWRRHLKGNLLPNLIISRTAEESMALNEVRSGAIIIAGSGMCNGGRIKHHLKHNVWRQGTHVVIVGYQAEGTVGRALVDGARYIRLWGETIRVAARVHTVGGLSAHADQGGLLDWYRHFRDGPPVTLVHGEAQAVDHLHRRLGEEGAAQAIKAEAGMSIDLATMTVQRNEKHTI